jgi:hypothetical protein
MLWDFNQDLAEKLLRLALCLSASQSEWQNAGLAYFHLLRAGEVTAEELREFQCLADGAGHDALNTYSRTLRVMTAAKRASRRRHRRTLKGGD